MILQVLLFNLNNHCVTNRTVVSSVIMFQAWMLMFEPILLFILCFFWIYILIRIYD
jgi:hypothetical protein